MASGAEQNTSRPVLIGVLAILLGAALTAVYWNHFDNSFHFDDQHTIVNNSYITDIRNLPLFFTDVQTTGSLPTNQSYRPVVTSLNAIDFWIAGELNPKVFHWHIYLEFLLLLLLMYHLFLSVFESASGKKHRMTALLGVGFFAFHTATAETINYIIARSDGFSTLMVLAGMLLFMRASGWKRQLGLIPFLVGFLTKPTAVVLAPLLAVYSILIEPPSLTVRSERSGIRSPLLRAVRDTSAYFLLGLGLYLFTVSMYPASWTPGGNYSSWQYLNTQAFVVLIYLKTFVLPLGLTADTDLQVIPEFLNRRVLWGLSVIFCLLIAAWISSVRRKTLPIAFGIMWFFIALLPSSSIIPLAEVMNHHRTFFPYIGLVMAATWAGFLIVTSLAGRQPSVMAKAVVSVIAVTVLCLHAWGTYQRNEVWDSDESLWRDVTIKSPKNGRGLMNYGLSQMRIGNIHQAIEYFESALETSYRNHPYLYINLGIASSALSDRSNDPDLKEKAESYLKQGLSLGPAFPQTHYQYAKWLNQHGRSEEALPHVQRALALAPASVSARQLEEAILSAGQDVIERAERDAGRANTPEAFLELSLQYHRRGMYEKCIQAAQTALELKPDYAPAFNNICSALNMLGQYDSAIEACQSALNIDPDFELARGNLNWARSSKESAR
jgi:Tfp pilus assembly protein PilF